ncbi:MAG TPA: PaaI family thioesterase, partial [Ignavibacteria bacterium]|nr:PaaI family thioesterase [Ignavibacteria bacterium]
MKENDTETIKRLQLLKEVMQNVMPVNKLLGVEIEKLEEGYAEVRVPFQKQFVGDFRRGLWHGGILASVADTIGGLVAMSLARSQDQVNTVDMRIDYLHGAVEDDIYGEAVLVKAGKRIILADVKLFQKQQEEPVVVARCAYSILR